MDNLITLSKYFYTSSDSTCEELWTHSFVPFHPYGLAGLAIDSKNKLLIAAGNYGKEPFPNVMGGRKSTST